MALVLPPNLPRRVQQTLFRVLVPTLRCLGIHGVLLLGSVVLCPLLDRLSRNFRLLDRPSRGVASELLLSRNTLLALMVARKCKCALPLLMLLLFLCNLRVQVVRRPLAAAASARTLREGHM